MLPPVHMELEETLRIARAREREREIEVSLLDAGAPDRRRAVDKQQKNRVETGRTRGLCLHEGVFL